MKKLLWYFLHRLKDLHSNNNLRKFGIILMDVFFQFFEVIYHIFYISNFYIFSRTKEIETIENGKSCIYTLRLIGPILYPGECDVMAQPWKYCIIFSQMHFVTLSMYLYMTCIKIWNHPNLIIYKFFAWLGLDVDS